MTVKMFLGAALMGAALATGPFAPSAEAETLRVVRQGTSSKLSVPINRAVVVESDVPFAELSIANPAIADISSLSDRTIYVLGKGTGTTTLTLLDASGRLITNVDVHVTFDLTEFKERLRQIMPDEKIEVRSADAMRASLHAALGDGRGHDIAIGLIGGDIMAFIGIGRGARGLERAVDAVGGAAHDLHLVDGVGACGRVELHGAYPFACAITDAKVRSARAILNRLSGVGRASANTCPATARGPCDMAASAASTRQGLCATPPKATRPAPSLPMTAATDTSAKA